jgi:Tfp pilus assembly protein PilN
MKAVNLIPGDSRPGWRGSSARSGASVYLLLGALAVAVALVTVYTLTTNRISDQKAKVAELRTEASQAESMAARLDPYVEFAKLAQARAETVREISSSRFDWHAALAGLSRVVPANTSLESLVGSVVPGASVSGAGASGTGTDLRGDIAAPAFQLSGCSDSQDDVARLVSQLRVIDGVTRVSLEDSQKSAGSQSGASVSSPSGEAACPAGSPTFDLVVFFKPLANAGADGVESLGTQAVSSTTSTGGSP